MTFPGKPQLLWPRRTPASAQSKHAVIGVHYAIAAALLLALNGCISVPQDIEQELTAPRPGEPDNYRRAAPAPSLSPAGDRA